ncbi:hypothetical protein Hdeb2414_s0007g00240401 [Helianthus debilis subsp. tardiflorus]
MELTGSLKKPNMMLMEVQLALTIYMMKERRQRRTRKKTRPKLPLYELIKLVVTRPILQQNQSSRK